MVLLIIIPMKNGYFIGNINPTFSDKPILSNSNQMDPKISSQEAVAPLAGAGNSNFSLNIFMCAESDSKRSARAKRALSARALNIDSISWRTSPSGSTAALIIPSSLDCRFEEIASTPMRRQRTPLVRGCQMHATIDSVRT